MLWPILYKYLAEGTISRDVICPLFCFCYVACKHRAPRERAENRIQQCSAWMYRSFWQMPRIQKPSAPLAYLRNSESTLFSVLRISYAELHNLNKIAGAVLVPLGPVGLTALTRKRPCLRSSLSCGVILFIKTRMPFLMCALLGCWGRLRLLS